MKPGAWHAVPGSGLNSQFAHTPSPTLAPPLCCNLLVQSFILSCIIPDPVGGKGPHKLQTFLGSYTCVCVVFIASYTKYTCTIKLQETELKGIIFICQTNVSYCSKEDYAEINKRWIRVFIKKKKKTICKLLTACALTASVCEWLHTLPSPVHVCLWCDVCIGSPLTRSSAIMSTAVCCVRWGGISPRAGLIGVKRAALKSHQCLEMLSETGNLLLGDFR